MNNFDLKMNLMNLSKDPRKNAATMETARKEIERLEEKVAELEKRVSDAGWEAEAQRERDEIARAKEWR